MLRSSVPLRVWAVWVTARRWLAWLTTSHNSCSMPEQICQAVQTLPLTGGISNHSYLSSFFFLFSSFKRKLLFLVAIKPSIKLLSWQPLEGWRATLRFSASFPIQGEHSPARVARLGCFLPNWAVKHDHLRVQTMYWQYESIKVSSNCEGLCVPGRFGSFIGLELISHIWQPCQRPSPARLPSSASYRTRSTCCCIRAGMWPNEEKDHYGKFNTYVANWNV